MKCTKRWHYLFHLYVGSEDSVTTSYAPGARPKTDYSISKYRCGICKKKWIIDHTKEEQEWEALRDKQ